MTLNFLQGQWWSTLYDLSNKTLKVTLEVTTHALEHWWEAGPLMRVRFTKVGKRQILWPCQLFSRRLFNQTCFFCQSCFGSYYLLKYKPHVRTQSPEKANFLWYCTFALHYDLWPWSRSMFLYLIWKARTYIIYWYKNHMLLHVHFQPNSSQTFDLVWRSNCPRDVCLCNGYVSKLPFSIIQ